MIKIEIPDECQEGCDTGPGCPFEYDGIYCKAYDRRLGLKDGQVKPDWCEASVTFVMETCPYCGNRFDDKQATHSTCGLE